MAARPWITPAELTNFTSHKSVKARTTDQLKADIYRAEAEIIRQTNNKFDDAEKYPTAVPDDIKLAVKLIAERYAFLSAQGDDIGKESESMDDHSWTSGTSKMTVDSVDIDALIRSFIIADNVRKNTFMRATIV